MDKKSYLEIRRQLPLQLKKSALTIYLIQDLCLWSFCAFAVGPWSQSSAHWLAIPALSILMFRNFSQMHDAVHGAVSKNKALNELMGILSGGVCLLPYSPWKKIHLEHHFWAGNIEKDPVMALVRTFPNWPKPLQKILGFTWKAWIPLLAIAQYGVFWLHSMIQFLKNPKSLKHSVSVLFPVAFWGGLLFFSPALTAVTLVLPAALLYLISVEVVNFPHHLGLPQHQGDTKLAIWDQHQIARSCLYPKLLARFVVLNFNYHVEHHLFPDAPWYTLEQIHRAVKAQLKSEYNSDPQFAWVRKNRSKTLQQLLITEQTQGSAQTSPTSEAA